MLTTACLLFAGLAADAQIIARDFPKDVRRGNLVVVAPPRITIDGRSEQLSPGARIRGDNNLLVLSGSIVGQQLLVNYVRDPQGQIGDVWVLTPQEAATKPPGPAP